jgi:hypothetical protein
MDYQPLQAPPSDHHQLNAGLSSELGATAKQLIEHVNAHFQHLYQVLKGEVAHVTEVADDDARAAVLSLSEHVTALEQKLEAAQAEIAALKANKVTAVPQTDSPNQSNQSNPALQALLQGATG